MAGDSESETELERDDEVEKLESDVRLMARRISEYRQTLNPADHLSSNLFLSPEVSQNISETDAPLVLGTQDSLEKMIQLKEITSRNATNIPKVVKRVVECMEGFNKLDSFHVPVHPAFTSPRVIPSPSKV